MYPRLLELPWTVPLLGQITIYTYGVLLAAAYLLGLKLAMVRAEARGLDGAQGARPRHLHHHQRAHRREAPAPRHRLPRVSSGPARAPDAGALGRRVLRRPDPRRHRRALVHPPRRTAAVDDLRRVRAGHRARSRRRPVRLPVRRLLLRQADDGALGHHVHRSVRGRQRRNAARRPAASRRSSTKRAPSS